MSDEPAPPIIPRRPQASIAGPEYAGDDPVMWAYEWAQRGPSAWDLPRDTADHVSVGFGLNKHGQIVLQRKDARALVVPPERNSQLAALALSVCEAPPFGWTDVAGLREMAKRSRERGMDKEAAWAESLAQRLCVCLPPYEKP